MDIYKNKESENEEVKMHRTILSFDIQPHQYLRVIIGCVVYLVVFIMLIPYLLLKYKHYDILTAYFPNVDMIATSLGYNGGPNLLTLNDNFWLYLYNPANFTLFGFISTTFINYFALLGMTFIVAYTTYTEKSWMRGWSKAFFMAFFTYLAPNNFIVLLQEYVDNKMGYPSNKETIFQYLLIAGIGLVFSYFIIMVETFFIKHFRENIIHLIDSVRKSLKY